MAKIGDIIKNGNKWELVLYPQNKIFDTKQEAENYFKSFFIAPPYTPIDFDKIFNK